MNTDLLRHKLKERFCRYAEIWTTSDSSAADNGILTSTPRQLNLAKVLVDELKTMGIDNAEISADGYVTASIPATFGNDSILLCAHLDTSEDVSGENVTVQLHENYSGTPIDQNGNEARNYLKAEYTDMGRVLDLNGMYWGIKFLTERYKLPIA